MLSSLTNRTKALSLTTNRLFLQLLRSSRRLWLPLRLRKKSRKSRGISSSWADSSDPRSISTPIFALHKDVLLSIVCCLLILILILIFLLSSVFYLVGEPDQGASSWRNSSTRVRNEVQRRIENKMFISTSIESSF